MNRWRQLCSDALVVFTVFIPQNSGLERFNYLVCSAFGSRATLVKVRGEEIPAAVEKAGGYGWTGNDLYQDYLRSKKNSSLRRVSFVPWPETTKPQLCLLGPEEYSLFFFEERLFSYGGGARIAVSTKYVNLARDYLEQQQWSATLLVEDGQVERQVRRGNADLAIDIVYSGQTCRDERLTIYDTIFSESGFVLLAKDI
ncbi:hypothetical protein HYU22_01190 [Candidatus Woesearchaeota archaeon]|nr:hypothetical protein [Candidatus Woesearchaeota archaeon]